MDDPSTAGVAEGLGLMFYVSRLYDPALGRFIQADTVVTGDKPTNAQTIQDVADSMYTPLTVNYSETPILMKHNADSAFIQGHGGTLMSVKEAEKERAKITDAPLETQALDRYSYALNNPIRYTDPTGHICKGDSNFGWCEKNGIVTLMINGYSKTIKLNEADNATLSAISNFKQEYENFTKAQADMISAAADTLLGAAGFIITGILAGITSPADLVPFVGQVKVALELAAFATTGVLAIKSFWEFINSAKDRNTARNNAFEIFMELPYPIVKIP